jgi:hypothetical protein
MSTPGPLKRVPNRSKMKTKTKGLFLNFAFTFTMTSIYLFTLISLLTKPRSVYKDAMLGLRHSYLAKGLLTVPRLKRLSRSGISGFLKSHKLTWDTTVMNAPCLTYLDAPINKMFTSLDFSSISTTPDVPILLMFDAPAPSIKLVPPETIIGITKATSQRWLRSVSPFDFLPYNPHDPGSPAANGTASFIACRPSNLHDPGPSMAFAYHIATAFTHLAFFALASYQLIDFLLIPPRSPSIVYIVS